MDRRDSVCAAPSGRMKALGVEGKRAAMPAKKKPPPKKRKPAPRARRSSAKKPAIEQRHWDLIGLGLVTFSVFLGFVLYRGRDGGDVGERTVDGLTWLLGDIAYAVPIGL